MTSPAALEVARSIHHALRLVRSAALATVASILLALPSRINYIGPHARTLNTGHKIWLHLPFHLQINLQINPLLHFPHSHIKRKALELPHVTFKDQLA